MAVWNLGSINADLFYAVPHLPGPGETLASTDHRRGLGGKGCNISVAIARAAARVHHIGCVGQDGRWASDTLLEYGVDTRHIREVPEATGHAIIATDATGENNIILFPGANQHINSDQLKVALSEVSAGDWFVTQNETNAQIEATRIARQMGLQIAYVAAPFDPEAVEVLRPDLDLLILNEVEAQQLKDATGLSPEKLGIKDVIVTLGPDGCVWHSQANSTKIEPIKVIAVDSTGAGDTFAGYVIACLDRGQTMEQALRTATLAGAIMVTRHGTADVIPDLKDLEDFRLPKV